MTRLDHSITQRKLVSAHDAIPDIFITAPPDPASKSRARFSRAGVEHICPMPVHSREDQSGQLCCSARDAPADGEFGL